MSETDRQLRKSLDHPNICKLFETYERAGLAYYVMELCEGKAWTVEQNDQMLEIPRSQTNQRIP